MEKPISNLNVIEEIKKNNLILDLTDYELNENDLELIRHNLDESKFIGLIKWNKKTLKNYTQQIDLIESILIKNNESYEQYPSDYIHCLLCSHSFKVDLNNENKTSTDKIFENVNYKILFEQKWEILEVFELDGYKSVVYINHDTKNIVLVFRGMSFKVSDFIRDKENKINTIIDSVLANDYLAPQTFYSFVHTESTVTISQSKYPTYSLSFTGYAFGAWLAEQAIFVCQKEFNLNNVKAVTFESPGSYDYINALNEPNILSKKTNFDLRDLNITNYFTSPNFVNTCNKHIEGLGKTYKIILEKPNDLDKLIIDILDLISNKKIKKKLNSCYFDKIKPKIKSYLFYINGLFSLMYDGLATMLNEFDSHTGKPRNYRQILDWPQVIFKPSEDYKNNFSNLFDFSKLISYVPFGQMIPDGIKDIISKVSNKILQTLVKLTSEKLFGGATAIINFVIEILNGNIDANQCLKCFEYDDQEYNDGKQDLMEHKEKKFRLFYEAHYKIDKVNLCQDIIDTNMASNDKLLYELFFNKNNLNSNNFMQKQLINLKQAFKIERFSTSFRLISNFEIEKLRSRLNKLILIDTNLINFILTSDSKVNDIELESDIEYMLEDDLIERKEKLDELDKVVRGYQYVYVFGRSGVGKTSFVRQYVETIQDEKIIRWIKPGKLFIEIERLGHQLNVIAADKKDIEEVFKSVRIKLNSMVKKQNLEILFIIDNLVYDKKTESTFKYLTYGYEKNVKFIITTKDLTQIDELIDKKNVKIFQIDLFNEDECFKLIHEKSKKFSLTDDEWRKLLQMLMNDTNKKILPTLLNKTLTKLNKKRLGISLDDLKQAIEDELENRYSLIKSENKYAFEILNYFSYLEGSNLNVFLIEKLFIETETAKSDKLKKRNKIEQALEYLEKEGEIKFNIKSNEYFIHETTQLEVLKLNEFNENKECKILNEIVQFLDANIDNSNVSKKKLTNNELILIIHAKKIVSMNWKDKSTVMKSLLVKMGKIFIDILVDYEKALFFYRTLLEINKETLDENDLDLAASYNNIGLVHDKKGENDKALKYFFKCLEIRKRILNENHLLIGNSYNDIGLVYNRKSEYNKALDYFNKSLEIKQKFQPINKSTIATTYNSIGLVYDNSGEYEKAIEYFEKSIELKKQIVPLNELSLAASFNNLSIVYDKQGKYDKALDYYERSFQIYNKLLAPNHPNIATLYNNIGLIYERKNDLNKAFEYYLKALEIRKQTLPPFHSNISTSFNNIGLVYNKQGEFDKAVEFLIKSLDIRKETLLPHHPNIATSYNNLGLVYESKGDYDKALEYFNLALEIRKKSLLVNHPDIAISYNSLASVYKNKNDYEKALEFYLKSLTIRKQTLPLNHPDIVSLYETLSTVYEKIGDKQKAHEYSNQFLELKT